MPLKSELIKQLGVTPKQFDEVLTDAGYPLKMSYKKIDAENILGLFGTTIRENDCADALVLAGNQAASNIKGVASPIIQQIDQHLDDAEDQAVDRVIDHLQDRLNRSPGRIQSKLANRLQNLSLKAPQLQMSVDFEADSYQLPAAPTTIELTEPGFETVEP